MSDGIIGSAIVSCGIFLIAAIVCNVQEQRPKATPEVESTSLCDSWWDYKVAECDLTLSDCLEEANGMPGLVAQCESHHNQCLIDAANWLCTHGCPEYCLDE